MRKLTFLLALAITFMSFSVARAQSTYYILAVKGKIYNQTTKTYLKPRTKINSSNKVVFKDKNAVAVLYSRGKGRFKLKLKNKAAASESAIFVKKTLFAQKQGAIARAANINSLTELKAHFNKARKGYLILGNRLELKINPAVFAKFGKGQPYIRYSYKGQQINKALKYKDSTLIIDREELFKVDGEEIQEELATDFIISYYIYDKESSVYIAEPETKQHMTFKPVFVAQEILKKEGLVELGKYLKAEKLPEEDVIQEMASNMVSLGTPNTSNVRAWYEKNIK
ncbi:hypothetical protein BKI52_09090 [marine bacterium AO1-C]|nr:hypothetical protein BKI52_09090 [marine bacterium AO1-C]